MKGTGARSLLDQTDWVEVLSALGIQCDTNYLPLTTECKVKGCAGTMSILYDEKLDCPWAYCPKCKFAGDGFYLACGRWDLSPREMMEKLIASGITFREGEVLPAQIESMLYHRFTRYERFVTAWSKFKNDFLERIDSSVEMRAVANKLGLRLSIKGDRWTNGPGKFIGGQHKGYIELAYRPDTRGREQNVLCRVNGADTIFTGPFWTDIVTIGCHDLPGRIKGFVFAGRTIDWTVFTRSIMYVGQLHNNVARTVPPHSRVDSDMGLAMYDVIETAGDTLFVMDDPLLAVRMQCWHMQDSTEPAPVVSIVDGSKYRTWTTVWNNVPSKKLIFWGRASGALYEHAKAVNGKVCHLGFEDSQNYEAKLIKKSFREWLPLVEQQAKPWRSALEEQLASLPTDKAEALLVLMYQPGSEIEKLMSIAPRDLQVKMDVLASPLHKRFVRWQELVYREQAEGWYVHKTGALVSNVVIRIDKQVYYPNNKETWYEGRLIRKGIEIAFFVNSVELENNLEHWIQKTIVRNRAGYFLHDRSKQDILLDLARSFNEPVTEIGVDSVGWNKENNCFVLPHYRIMRSGEIQQSKAYIPRFGCSSGIMSKRFELPSREVLQRLDKSPGVSQFWAMTACVISNLLAPVYDLPVRAIGIYGEEANSGGRNLAKALGCGQTSVKYDADYVAKLLKIHGWPIFVRNLRHSKPKALEILFDNSSASNKSAIIALNPYQAITASMREDWYTFKVDLLATYLDCSGVDTLIPAFLQYMCKNKFFLPGGPNLPLRVIDELRIWIKEYGGRVPIKAARLIEEHYTAMPLIRVLCEQVRDGSLSVERAGFIPRGKLFRGVIAVPDNKAIFLPAKILKKCIFPDDIAPTAGQLRKVLGNMFSYTELPGWLLPEDVWNATLKDLETKAKTTLVIE